MTLKKVKNITFDELLCNLNLTEENYKLALHSSLSSPTVLKRVKN